MYVWPLSPVSGNRTICHYGMWVNEWIYVSVAGGMLEIERDMVGKKGK